MSRDASIAGHVGASQQEAKTLTDLPNEVILEIVENLKSGIPDALIQKPYPLLNNDTGEPDDGPDGDTIENKRRQGTLWSLCLTSKRISALSTPILYSSITLGRSTRTKRQELIRLSRLLSTLIQKPQLSRCVTAVTACYDDHWGSYHNKHLRSGLYLPDTEWSTFFDTLKDKAATIWGHGNNNLLSDWADNLIHCPDVCEIALLVALAPSISYLRLSRLRNRELFLLPLLGLLNAESSGISACNFHGLRKLEWLNLYCWIDGSQDENRAYDYHSSSLMQSCQRLPMLRRFTLDGLLLPRSALEPPIRGFFPQLESVSLKLDGLFVGHGIDVVSGCHPLTHFTLERVLNVERSDGLRYESDLRRLPDLLTALYPSKETLQYLYLPEVWVSLNKRSGIAMLQVGDFSGFTRLKSLAVPQEILFGASEAATRAMLPLLRLSERLPPGLVTLIIWSTPRKYRGNKSVLWHFADDLHQLPHLRRIVVKTQIDLWDPFSRNQWAYETLIARFAERGVTLTF
jgi:hypothetical protein